MEHRQVDVREALERVTATAGALKVFPLPSVVLLPHTAVPLHIFEPRYRAMVQDALATDQVIALGQLEPGWEPHYAGRPALKQMVCAGVISWHEALEDGRYAILLAGICRARVLRESDTPKLYREVQAELLPDPLAPSAQDPALRRAALELATHLPSEAATELVQACARVSGGALADVLAASLVRDIDRRYALLCEVDLVRRQTAVLEELSLLIAQLAPPAGEGPLN